MRIYVIQSNHNNGESSWCENLYAVDSEEDAALCVSYEQQRHKRLLEISNVIIERYNALSTKLSNEIANKAEYTRNCAIAVKTVIEQATKEFGLSPSDLESLKVHNLDCIFGYDYDESTTFNFECIAIKSVNDILG